LAQNAFNGIITIVCQINILVGVQALAWFCQTKVWTPFSESLYDNDVLEPQFVNQIINGFRISFINITVNLLILLNILFNLCRKNNMHEFNTTGPCNPTLHYTVMREALITTSLEQVKKGRYFTLFAPRQAGKTTFFQLIIEKLKESYTPIWITFENLTTVNSILSGF
jgi:hypothetical protein